MAGASASLVVPSTAGMTVQFSPSSQTLTTPGRTSFLLLINNTGNVQDSYTAVITGTTGPVAASLLGLDGSPTSSIPMFRLVGLAEGALSLQVEMTAPGQGTVTVMVKSLTTGETMFVTVTVLTTEAADGPKVTNVQRFGFHAMPTQLVLSFDQPLDVGRAQDVGLYEIVDPHGHKVAIKSAVYDATSRTVTLLFKRRINLHHTYKLTVLGATPSGLSDVQGLLLDGKADGQPGGNYVTTITYANLVKPANWNPKWDAQFNHEKHHQAVANIVKTGKHALFKRLVPFSAHATQHQTSAKPALQSTIKSLPERAVALIPHAVKPIGEHRSEVKSSHRK
jgi:hypothetical protein